MPAPFLGLHVYPAWQGFLHTHGVQKVQGDERHPDESGRPVEAAKLPTKSGTPRLIVDTDIELAVYGLEDADGTLGAMDQDIRHTLHGMSVGVNGHHFVLFLRDPRPGEAQKPDVYFWADELHHE